MITSPRLALPLLAPGQAQKEMTHNEALARLDMITQTCVQAIGGNTPPTDPVPGQCWIIGPVPEGSWTGKAQQLGGWTENGWRFVQPFDGLSVWTLDEDTFARWNGEAWVVGTLSATALNIDGEQVVGLQQAAIANPAGGAIVDVEARAAIGSVLVALRNHGLIHDAV